MRIPLFSIIALILFLGCSNQSEPANTEYLRWVGDIKYDSQKDSPEFTLCNGEEKVFQYFNFGAGLQFKGEKKAIKQQFLDKFQPIKTTQSGWIRIRFIVNCEGKTGRFRIISSDLNYKQMDFDKGIIEQLLVITKGLKDWSILSFEKDPLDYYQYLLFKIDNGKIVEILP